MEKAKESHSQRTLKRKIDWKGALSEASSSSIGVGIGLSLGTFLFDRPRTLGFLCHLPLMLIAWFVILVPFSIFARYMKKEAIKAAIRVHQEHPFD